MELIASVIEVTFIGLLMLVEFIDTIKNKDECYCGNDPYQYVADSIDYYYLIDYVCNYECKGDSNQTCGGGWRLSVYETGQCTAFNAPIEYQAIKGLKITSVKPFKRENQRSKLYRCQDYSKIECEGFVPMEQKQTLYTLLFSNTILTAPANHVLTLTSNVECACHCFISINCKVFVTSGETGHCSLYNGFEVMCDGIEYTQDFEVYAME